jgi:hypothetical protein
MHPKSTLTARQGRALLLQALVRTRSGTSKVMVPAKDVNQLLLLLEDLEDQLAAQPSPEQPHER